MACIAKRRGKWVVDYRIGGKRFTPSFQTKGESELFLREIRLRRIDSLIGYNPIRETLLTVAAEEYLRSVTTKKSERTAEVDKIALAELLAAFPRTTVQELSAKEIEFYQSRLSVKFHPSTVNRRFNVLKHFFRKCVEWNYTFDNPTKSLVKLQEPESKKVTLVRNDIELMTTVCPPWAQDILQLISRTGIRRNEAINLEWKDVAFEKKTFLVHSRKGGRFRQRDIPMTSTVYNLFLKKWNEAQKTRINSSLVFVNKNGLRINPRTLSSAVSKAGRKVGLKNAGLHILRHSILTDLAEINQSGSIIQKLAGHSNLITTQRYIHHNTEAVRSSLEKLEESRG